MAANLVKTQGESHNPNGSTTKEESGPEKTKPSRQKNCWNNVTSR